MQYADVVLSSLFGDADNARLDVTLTPGTESGPVVAAPPRALVPSMAAPGFPWWLAILIVGGVVLLGGMRR